MSARLITIPISHYCDKARWALEHCGLAYEEEAHVQIFHYVATLRRGAGVFVPVLVLPGETIPGSHAIARWADAHRATDRSSLYPPAHREAIEALENKLDAEFGVPGRLFMYHEALRDPQRHTDYLLTGVPAYQRHLTPHIIRGAAYFIRRRLGVDREASERARDQCMRVLDDIATQLGAERYLFGDTFTAADLTFAALSAPLTLPTQYGVPLPTVDELSPGYAALVREVRAHPAGVFALRLYSDER